MLIAHAPLACRLRGICLSYMAFELIARALLAYRMLSLNEGRTPK